MCSLQDAWGSNGRRFYGAPQPKPTQRSQKEQWYTGPTRGHFTCSGFDSDEEFEQQAAAPPPPQIPPQSMAPIVVQPDNRPISVTSPPPQVYVVTEPSCGKSWEHLQSCSHCRQRYSRDRHPYGYNDDEGLQLRWWHLILGVVGTAILAALFLRLFMPAPTTIYRQIGIKTSA